MALDSEVYFAKRVEALGLGGFVDRFRSHGWRSLGTFASAANFTPGSGRDETPFIDGIVIPILGDRQHEAVASLRRLFAEANAMYAAEMQRVVSRGDEDDKPRKLLAVEREHRLTQIRTRLPGILIHGHTEPADAVIDKFTAMQEEGVLRYVKWEDLISRDQAMVGVKTDSDWRSDRNGYMKEHKVDKYEPADLGTDLKLRCALQRRGVAMEMARLCSYEVHEKYVSWLLAELMRSPPEGHGKATLQQVSHFGALGLAREDPFLEDFHRTSRR